MAWEEVQCRGGGKGEIYGFRWKEVPAMSVCKTGVTFNRPAVQAFGLECGAKLRVFTSQSPPSIGIKICVPGESTDGAYTMGHNGRKNLKSVGVTCKLVVERFKDAAGKAYRLKLVAGERIIVAELTEANKL